MSVRTVHFRLSATPPTAAHNVWPVRITRSVFLGDLTQLHVDWGGREVIIRQTVADAFAEGATVYLSVDPNHCVLLEPGAADGQQATVEAPPEPVLAPLPTE